MSEGNEGDRELTPIFGENQKMEVEGSFTIEAPPRDVQKAFDLDETVVIEADLPGFKDGDYRSCDYCEGDSLVHVDHYDDHLRQQHDLDP